MSDYFSLGERSSEVSLVVRVLGDCTHWNGSAFKAGREMRERNMPSEAFEEGTVNFSGREAGSGVRNLAGRGLPEEDSLFAEGGEQWREAISERTRKVMRLASYWLVCWSS